MKKIIKDNFRIGFQTVLIVIISSTISVSAAVSIINANQVEYSDSNKVATVSAALDTLYDSIDVATILPAGSIIPYMGKTAPENYLICDGSTYNIADYQKLADHIKDDFGSYNYFGGDGETTFAVPDLRGEFLRGAGTNSHANQGSGASVGVHQNSTQFTNLVFGGSATNSFIYYTDSGTNGNSWSDLGYDNLDSTYGASVRSKTVTSAGFINNTTAFARFTSRPTNTSVNYIIKVK